MKKVLIVEAELSFGMAYVRAFVVGGFNAVHATSAGKASAMLGDSRPDVVVLCLRPRDARALSLIEEIRSAPRTRTLPIIAFARDNVGEMMDDAQSKGATESFMLGPGGAADLVNAVNRAFPSSPKSPPPAVRKPDSEAQAPVRAPTQLAASIPEPPVKQSDVPRQPARPPTAPARPAPAPRRDPPGMKGDSIQKLREFSRNLFATRDRSLHEPLLREMHELMHSFVAGMPPDQSRFLTQFMQTFLGLLRELSENPGSASTSNLRTLMQAVHCLEWLLQQPPAPDQDEADFKILSVDDDPSIRNLIKLGLTSARLGPDSAKDATEGLDLSRRRRYELFILDVNMPGLSGFELCEKLRASPQYKRTPVIFVTGSDTFESRVRSAGIGGSDFIGKPFLVKELAVKVLIHLLPHRLGDESR